MTKILQSIPYPTYTTAERDLLVDVLKNTYINNSDTGKVEEYDGVNWVAQGSGSGSSTPTSKTYTELQDLVLNNLLIPESVYILTDYQTKHLIPNSDPQEINIGNIEPLTLIAATTNTFYVEVKSSLFPTDIIRYRFDDDSCEDGTRDVENKKWVSGTPRTGYIQYRKSTTNNLSTHYDWRNYKVRRWKLDAVELIRGTVYNPKDIVKSSIDLNLYVCKKVTTALDTTDPSQDDIHYQLYLNLTIQSKGGFLSPVSNNASYNIDNINNTNIIINNTTPDIDYKDYYTFCILTEPTNSSGVVLTNTNGGIIGEGFKEFEIGKFDFDYFNYYFGNGTDLESNVFYLTPYGDSEYYVRDNKFGSNATYNTFENHFHSNTIGDNFHSNTIGNGFNSNTIGDNFYSNNIGYNFRTNTIGNSFSSNTIGGDFHSNNIRNDFTLNTIGDNFNTNTIGDTFYSNTIGNSFYSNTIGDGFQSNTIGDNFNCNDIKVYIVDIDWLNTIPTPTHVYQPYNCTIFNNSANVPRLSYYDENDQLIIIDPIE